MVEKAFLNNGGHVSTKKQQLASALALMLVLVKISTPLGFNLGYFAILRLFGFIGWITVGGVEGKKKTE